MRHFSLILTGDIMWIFTILKHHRSKQLQFKFSVVTCSHKGKSLVFVFDPWHRYQPSHKALDPQCCL